VVRMRWTASKKIKEGYIYVQKLGWVKKERVLRLIVSRKEKLDAFSELP